MIDLLAYAFIFVVGIPLLAVQAWFMLWAIAASCAIIYFIGKAIVLQIVTFVTGKTHKSVVQ